MAPHCAMISACVLQAGRFWFTGKNMPVRLAEGEEPEKAERMEKCYIRVADSGAEGVLLFSLSCSGLSPRVIR